MSSITELIDKILEANKAQSMTALFAYEDLVRSGNQPKSTVLPKKGALTTIYSGLSKAFNTRTGSPRFSIRKATAGPNPRPRKADAPLHPEVKEPQTFSWTPLTTMEAGLTIPYLYGTMKTKGNVITGNIGGSNNTAIQQQIGCVVAVSKGPIESFVSLSVNGETPWNIPDQVNIDYRYGWNNQPILSNWNDAYRTISMNDTVVNAGDPVVVSLDMSGYDDAWIYLKFPSGLYSQANSSSDLADEGCHVRVSIRPVGGDYKLIYGGFIHANRRVITRYYIRLYLDNWGHYFDPLADVTYEVLIAKMTSDKKSSDIHSDPTDKSVAENSLVVENIGVGSRDDFAYNGIALVAIMETATESLNGSLDISTVVKGRKVSVYTTPTSYTLKWSDNPAWVCFDILTQPIWDNASYSWGDLGGGVYGWIPSTFTLARYDGIDPSEIDIQSFIDWAYHCNEIVDSPAYYTPEQSGNEKRCTFNGIFESMTNIWDAAQSVAENARAWLIPPSGTSKYKVILDKITSLTQMFTTANIIQDSLEETYTSIADRAYALQVDFVNQENDWEPETLNVVYQIDTSREETMSLFGITVPSQAWRRAMLDIYYNAYVTVEVQFNVGQDALNCEVGDVVGVQSELPQWGYGGRIVSATNSVIELDREVEILTGTNYQLAVRSSDDTLTTYSIAFSNNPATGATYTLNGTFSPVPVLYDPFAFGKTEGLLVYKPFRVLEIKNNGDETFNIVAQEYNSSIYNIDADTPPIPTPNYSSLNAFPSVTDVLLDEILIKNQDGSIIDCIDVYFNRPNNSLYSEAEIYYRQKGSSSGGLYPPNWVFGGRTNTEKFRILDVIVNAYYEVSIVTVNTAGRKGRPDSSPIEEIWTLGKADPPSNVVDFRASQSGKILVFTWDHIEDADLWGYEIRQGMDFATSLQIIDIQSANRYDYPAPFNGTYRFWIKAIDTSGNYSTIPTSIDVSVTGIEDTLNFVYGPTDKVTDYNNSGQLKYNYVWHTNHFDWSVATGSVGAPGYWRDFTNDPNVLATYETKDLEIASAPVKATIRLDQELEATLEDATDMSFPDRLDTDFPNDTDLHITTTAASYLYYSFSNTTPATGNFTRYITPVQETFRYMRARHIVVADNYDTVVELSHLRAMADMADILFDIRAFDITNATGAVIQYSTYGVTMTCPNPSVQATITYGTSLAAFVSVVPVISRVNSSFFQIELKDIVGQGRISSAAGKVNIQIHGY